MSSQSYTVQAILRATDANFTSTMSKASHAAQSTFEKIKSIANSNDSMMGKIGQYTTMVGQGLTTVGQGLTKYVSLPLAGVGTASVMTAAKFEKQMNRVKAISGATGKEFQQLRDQAIDLGAKSVFSATEVAQAQEMMASAGFNSNQIYAAMPGVMDLAAVSGGDMALASEAAATAVNMFGLEAGKATHVADVFAKAAADTNAEVGDMAEAMKYVGPVAGAMGISLEETAAAIGIMSNAGIKGSQAGTTLRTAMTRLANPTDKMKEVMESLGLEFFDSEGKMKSLSDITNELRDKTAGLTDEQKSAALSTLFGKESLSGMLALVNASPDALAKQTQALRDSDGAAKQMADTMNSGTAGAIENLKGALESAGIAIGERLAPYINKAANFISKLVDKFNQLPGPVKDAIVIFGIIAAAIGPVLIIIGQLISAVGTIMSVFGGVEGAAAGLSAAFGILTGPIGIVIGIIAGLITILIIAWNTSETFRNTIINGWNTIVSAVSPVIETFKTLVSEVFSYILSHSQGIIDGLVVAWNGLVTILGGIWTLISGVIQAAMAIIDGIIKTVMALIKGDWEGAWNAIKEMFSKVWNSLGTIVQGALQILEGVIVAGVGIIITVWNVIWETVKAVFQAVWNAITAIAIGVWNGLVALFNIVWPALQAAWEVIWNAVSTVFSTIWNAIVAVATAIWNGLVTVFQTALNIIQTVWSTVWETIKIVFAAVLLTIVGLVTGNFDLIKQAISNAWDMIKSKTSEIWNAISSFISSVLSAIASTVSNIWNSIKSTVSNVMDGIKSAISNAWNSVKSTVSNVMSAISSAISNGWNQVVSTVTSAGSQVVDAVRNAFNNAVNAAKNFVGQAVGIGANLISGFVQGVANAAGKLISAVKDAVGNAINAAKSLLGIHSPSRVFRQFGIFTDEGFVIGVNKKANKVAGAVSDMASGAISAFEAQDVAGAMQRHLDDGVNHLNANTLGLALSEMTTNVQSSIDVQDNRQKQPLAVTLSLGGRQFKAFVQDITDVQAAELRMEAY